MSKYIAADLLFNNYNTVVHRNLFLVGIVLYFDIDILLVQHDFICFGLPLPDFMCSFLVVRDAQQLRLF